MNKDIKKLEKELNKKKIISSDLSRVLVVLRKNQENRSRKIEEDNLDQMFKTI